MSQSPSGSPSPPSSHFPRPRRPHHPNPAPPRSDRLNDVTLPVTYRRSRSLLASSEFLPTTMIPAAAPPSPQEIHQKLSSHPSTKGKIPTKIPFGPLKAPVSGTGTGTESDSASDSVLPSDVFVSSAQAHTSAGGMFSDGPSQQPLSSIAEHHSGSGEDSDEDEEDEGVRNANLLKNARASANEGVIKSGYLWKKGERRKTWKKRWFVLRPAHLAYYKSSAEYQLLRLLHLSDVHSCTQVTLKKHENTFGLVSADRTFYLQAKTQAEVHEWIKALEVARQALMATSTENSIHGSISIPAARDRSGSLSAASLTPSPPHHRPARMQNITSSDSDDPSPQALHNRSGSAHIQPVPASPTKNNLPVVPDPAKTVLSGYLMKCGSKRRNWRKRWFILTGEHLMYSASHMDTKPHGKFQFSEIIDALEYDLPLRHNATHTTAPVSISTSTGVTNTEEVDDTQNKHTFKIITTKRTLLLCAPTEEEEIKWLGAVRALIARRLGSGVMAGDTGSGKSTA